MRIEQQAEPPDRDALREETKVANMTVTADGIVLSADGIASRKVIGED